MEINIKEATLAGLFHDIATPCFSHVIDYMNKDYENQESTEEYTESILKNDSLLNRYLKQDGININDITDFKKYNIVDNKRPKLCTDRLDGVILTGIAWTKNISLEDIQNIIKDIEVYDDEVGFKSINIANKVLDVNNSINEYCHSKEDSYMMELLASITKHAIDNNVITYDELYNSTEKDILFKIKTSGNDALLTYFNEFETITLDKIPNIQIPNIKYRNLNPLIKGKRLE